MHTLSKPILLFPHDFVLDEEEGKEWGDHVVEGSNGWNDVVVLDVTVGPDRELRGDEVDEARIWTGLVSEDGVVNEYLLQERGTLSALATSSMGKGSSKSWKITPRLFTFFNTR